MPNSYYLAVVQPEDFVIKVMQRVNSARAACDPRVLAKSGAVMNVVRNGAGDLVGDAVEGDEHG